MWHVVFIRQKCLLRVGDFKKYLKSLVFPSAVLELIDLLELVQRVAEQCLRFSSFPDNRLVLFML